MFHNENCFFDLYAVLASAWSQKTCSTGEAKQALPKRHNKIPLARQRGSLRYELVYSRKPGVIEVGYRSHLTVQPGELRSGS